MKIQKKNYFFFWGGGGVGLGGQSGCELRIVKIQKKKIWGGGGSVGGSGEGSGWM